MPRLLLAFLAFALVTLPAFAEEPPVAAAPPPAAERAIESADNPLAIVKTSMGDFVVELFVKEAPKTVENFLGLAEGTKAFTDPVSGEEIKRNYFDDQIFHRVIDNFMIQGGSIDGTGSGGPGYRFENEINGKALGLDKEKAVVFKGERMGAHPHLLIRSQQEFTQTIIGTVFKKLGIDNPAQAQERQAEVEKAMRELTVLDVYKAKGFKFLDAGASHGMEKGTLAMANAGPGTNGSQFYVNLRDNPYLNGKHTVFGHVVKGMDVVERIGKVKVDKQAGNRPVEDVKILSIRRYVPASE